MISPRMNRRTTILLLALICSTASAGEPNEIPIQLSFEISPTPLDPGFTLDTRSAVYPVVSRRPPFAAAIALVPPTEWLPSPLRRTMSNFLGNERLRGDGYAERQGGLSEQQKAFLEETKSVFNYPTSNLVQRRPDPNGPECVLLYAMNLEDAKKMAQAYFQYARDEWWRGYARKLDREIRATREKIVHEEARTIEVDSLVEASQKSLDDLGKAVLYRTESEAHEAIGELDRMLNAAQVEIAGITAKTTAIQMYQGERLKKDGRPLPPEAVARLDMMFIEESIVLRGAEARKQMAARLREQANRFVDLKSTLASAAEEKKTLAESLPAKQKDLATQQGYLESAKQHEPRIPGKVVIYPVQWADEATQK